MLPSNTTRILLCRHGETDWNREGRYQGTRDIPLNDRGRQQAQALAAALKDIPIDAAFSSPLSRASETAEIVMQAKKVPVPFSLVPALQEIGHGVWEGRLADEFAREQPAEYAAWRDAAHTLTWQGGESVAQVQKRATAAFEKIIREHQGKTVLVVAHDGVNRALLLWATGAPLEKYRAFRQDSACLNVLEVAAGDDGALKPTLVLLNSVAHHGRVFVDAANKTA